jgi:hypothetical protein
MQNANQVPAQPVGGPLPATPMQVNVRSNRDLYSGQIHDCLAAIAHLTQMLRVASGAEGNSEMATLPPLDKEARAAMEASLMQACNRLDELMNDSKRWKVPAVDAHTLGMEFLQSQIRYNHLQVRSLEIQIGGLKERIEQENAIIAQSLVQQLRAEFKARGYRVDDGEAPPTADTPPGDTPPKQ